MQLAFRKSQVCGAVEKKLINFGICTVFQVTKLTAGKACRSLVMRLELSTATNHGGIKQLGKCCDLKESRKI